MKHRLVAYVVALFLAGGPVVRANDSSDPNVATLARDYRELRAKRQQQLPGVRIKELDDSGGRLERTLSALGVALGHPPHTRREILKIMGAPDAIRRDREMANFLGIYERERRKSAPSLKPRRDRKYLIYFWRGGHDFLFFISEGGLIVDHGWWFAYE